MTLTNDQKNLINYLKAFYINHMIETYEGDYDKFWEQHEDLIQLKMNLNFYKSNTTTIR